MNAAVLAHGLTVGGRDGAKEALESFWKEVGESADFSPLRPTVIQELTSDYSAPTPAFMIFDLMTRLVSPYQFNPLNINPLYRDEVPTAASDILNRINEISFNSSLMREMRAIAFVTNLIDDDELPHRRMKRMLIHSIEADEVMRDLGVHTKMTPSWRFLTHLRDLGREHAGAWLQSSLGKVGRQSSVDIRDKYL